MLMHNDDDFIQILNNRSSGPDISVHRVNHILVADDNHANRLIAKTILERDGYVVTLAVNGLEALTAIKDQAAQSLSEYDQPFDIILMDILMPIMDGMKALRRIKALAPSITIPPIFAITAFCSPADQHRYRMAGFDAILTKPLRHGDVERAIRQHSFGIAAAPTDNTPIKSYDFGAINIFDDGIVNQLRNAANIEQLKTIQDTFWNDIKTSSKQIQTVLPGALKDNSEDLSTLRKSVHAIKGVSASVGLQRVSHIARHLQNAPPSQIPRLLQALFQTLITSKRPLNTALSQPAGAHNALNPNCVATLQSGANARTG